MYFLKYYIMNENFYVRVKVFYNRGRENMKRRIIVVMFLMCFITMATSLESIAETISRTHTASKYVTKVIEKVAYTVSGTVNYDKKSGLMTKDYVS